MALKVQGTTVVSDARVLQNIDALDTTTITTISAVVKAGADGTGSNSAFWVNDKEITADYTIPNNKNGGTFGPITINSGVTVTIGSGETWTVA